MACSDQINYLVEYGANIHRESRDNNFGKKLIQKNYLSETLIEYITIKILEGLQNCYQCKITRLDIKPQNPLINNFLIIKIKDFSNNRFQTYFSAFPMPKYSFEICFRHENIISLISLSIIGLSSGFG